MRHTSALLYYLMLLQSLLITHALRAARCYRFARYNPKAFAPVRSQAFLATQLVETPDALLTGLNGAQDVSVKVVSCRNIVDHIVQKGKLSSIPAKYLGEVITCSLMMGAGLKGEESLQINLVGTHGMKNIMAITDGELNIRGMVGNPKFTTDTSADELSMDELLGPGQIQIVRTHPTWKHPMNGITELRNTSVSMNLALYMGESEQRPTAILTDVQIEDGRCVSALGIMVETLPGAVEENIETSINNLGLVQKKGLQSYLSPAINTPVVDQHAGFIPTMTTMGGGTLNAAEQSRAAEILASLDTPMDKILDDCMVGMEVGSIRWSKTPKFKCSCGVNKVYRALKLLPKAEVQSMIDSGEDVNMKCEFCGEQYCVPVQDIREKVLAAVGEAV